MSSNSQSETIAFFGASTGVGLAALKSTLASGRKCIALCRTPSKLSALVPTESNPNLEIVQGNAHDITSVSNCLLARPGVLVDQVISTIGGAFIASKMTLDDPEVCQKGMAVLLEALTNLRREGAVGKPRIIVYSTTGMSRFGRDIPIAMIPLYHVMLKVPHADKIIMEDRLVESGEAFTIIRGSFMVSDAETNKEIRVGIEDPQTGRESKAIGYFISKSDAGRWMAEHLVIKRDDRYLNKIAMITQ
ncbi:hypothetical protein F5Y16DRAFT_403607 [Xylariaceae sp. FL0255]|nr:hypothetical protein F5Y16DRAFT_403607 [Xylariaceae sp. FL0255]